jgi:hypothetical protein
MTTTIRDPSDERTIAHTDARQYLYQRKHETHSCIVSVSHLLHANRDGMRNYLKRKSDSSHWSTRHQNNIVSY